MTLRVRDRNGNSPFFAFFLEITNENQVVAVKTYLLGTPKSEDKKGTKMAIAVDSPTSKPPSVKTKLRTSP